MEHGKDQKYKEEAWRLQFRLRDLWGAGRGARHPHRRHRQARWSQGLRRHSCVIGVGTPHMCVSLPGRLWASAGFAALRWRSRRRRAAGRRSAAERPVHGPSAPLRRVADNHAVDVAVARWARAAARRRALASTSDESVIALLVSIVDHVVAPERVYPHQRVVANAHVLELEPDFLGPSPSAHDIPPPPQIEAGLRGAMWVVSHP